MLSRRLVGWVYLYMHMYVNASIIFISECPNIESGLLDRLENQNIKQEAFKCSTIVSKTQSVQRPLKPHGVCDYDGIP